jgi:hypothetical protein
MLLSEPTETEQEPVTRREPLSRRREPELLGAVLVEVVLEIFRRRNEVAEARRRVEIAEAELAREEDGCH